ncbi:MAG: hypothetical protein ACKVOK_08295 [Flavobacteriales bacterium]
MLMFLAIACRHEQLVEPVINTCPDGYPLTFGFVNHADTTVKMISFKTKCWRANVDSSYITYRQYESLESDPDDQFPLTDSLVHKQFSCATAGSWKWAWIEITQRNPDGTHIRISEWTMDTSDWVYMYEPEDFMEYFRWPEDTLRYIKTYDWRPE